MIDNIEEIIVKYIRPTIEGAYQWVCFEIEDLYYTDANGWIWLVANGKTIGSIGSGADIENSKFKTVYKLLFLDTNLDLLDSSGIPISSPRSLSSAEVSFDNLNRLRLPDVRGRTLKKLGQGLDLSIQELGAISGTETIKLLENQLPSHTHGSTLTGQGLHLHSGTSEATSDHQHTFKDLAGTVVRTFNSSGNFSFQDGPGSQDIVINSTQPAGSHNHTFTTNTGEGAHSHAISIFPTGNGDSISIESPFLTAELLIFSGTRV